MQVFIADHHVFHRAASNFAGETVPQQFRWIRLINEA
jgi:hypothetical protein